MAPSPLRPTPPTDAQILAAFRAALASVGRRPPFGRIVVTVPWSDGRIQSAEIEIVEREIHRPTR